MRSSGLWLIVFIAAVLTDTAETRGQTAADHAASAHGKPIVQGNDVQPTPDVVKERWRHHMLMLEEQKREAASKPGPPAPLPPRRTK